MSGISSVGGCAVGVDGATIGASVGDFTGGFVGATTGDFVGGTGTGAGGVGAIGGGPTESDGIISIADSFGLSIPPGSKLISRKPSSTSATKSKVIALLFSPPPIWTRSILGSVVPSTSTLKTRFPGASS